MTDYPCTDLGNAKRFVRDHRDNVRWVEDDQEWAIWQGDRWQRHKSDERIHALAGQTVVSILLEAAQVEDDDRRRRVTTWAGQSQSASRIRAMTTMVKAEPSMWAQSTEFDRQPHLLNFKNGTVDLRTGLLKPHDPDDLLSSMVPHNFVPDAQAPMWDAVIKRCVKGYDADGSTAAYLMRALGYMLLGNNPEQLMFLVVGDSGTGKSLVVELVAQAVGLDYAKISLPKLIIRSRSGGHHESETYSLRGKRFVAISETSASMDLDEAIVKALTGSSTFAVRGLYKATEMQIPATWTLMVVTNDEPNIERWDAALARRIVKIPSGPTVPEDERDGSLMQRILDEEAEGLLASLVRSCVAWHQDGLQQPEAVARATSAFGDANDHVADFIRAQIDAVPGASVASTAVNKAYLEYRGKGVDVLKRDALYTQILRHFRDQGVEVTRDSRKFHGIRLADTVEAWVEEYGR